MRSPLLASMRALTELLDWYHFRLEIWTRIAEILVEALKGIELLRPRIVLPIVDPCHRQHLS